MLQCTPLSRNRDSQTQKLGRFFKNENKNKVVGVTKMKIYGLDCLPLADSRREKKTNHHVIFYSDVLQRCREK